MRPVRREDPRAENGPWNLNLISHVHSHKTDEFAVTGRGTVLLLCRTTKQC